jgi:hypothetical protein
MKLDDFNHELPGVSDAGLYVWVEVVAMMETSMDS